MNFLKSALILITLVLYSFSLGFYTLYGIFKSYNEYFCIQGRADNQDYFTEISARYVNFSGFKEKKVDDFISFMGSDIVGFVGPPGVLVRESNAGKTYTELYTNVSQVYKDGYVMDYKVSGNYFHINCRPHDVKNTDPETLEDWSKSGIDRSAVWSDGLCFDEAGYLRECQDVDLVAFTQGDLILKTATVKCKLSKSPHTCSMKQSTSDLFYRAYLTMVLIFMLMVPICFIDYRDHLLLRKIYLLQQKLKEMNPIEFCNPIHGMPVYMEAGSKVCKLFMPDDERQCVLGEEEGLCLEEMIDLRGKYFLIKNTLNIKIKGKDGYILHLTDSQCHCVRRYFYITKMNENLCVVDHGESHYLKTEDVLNQIALGMTINFQKKLKSGYILKVDTLTSKILEKSYDIKSGLINYLVEHNDLFFGGVVIDALKLCIENKMHYSKRPENVKNSQWKWYSSDFCTIMKRHGYTGYKSQVFWRDSRALRKLGESLEPPLAETSYTEILRIENKSVKKDIEAECKSSAKRISKTLAGWDEIMMRLELIAPVYKSEPEFDNYTNLCLEFKNEMLGLCDEVKSMKESMLTQGVKVNEIDEIWGKEKKELVTKMTRVTNKVLSYKEALMKPTIEYVKPSETDKLNFKVKKTKLPKRIEKKHVMFDVISSQVAEIKRKQHHVKDYINSMDALSEMVKSAPKILEESVGRKPAVVFSVDSEEIANDLIGTAKVVAIKPKSNKPLSKKERKKLRKASEEIKEKDRNIVNKKISHMKGVKKYFSSNFVGALKAATSLVKKEPLKAGLRCKAVIELRNLIMEKALGSRSTPIYDSDPIVNNKVKEALKDTLLKISRCSQLSDAMKVDYFETVPMLK